MGKPIIMSSAPLAAAAGPFAAEPEAPPPGAIGGGTSSKSMSLKWPSFIATPNVPKRVAYIRCYWRCMLYLPPVS